MSAGPVGFVVGIVGWSVVAVWLVNAVGRWRGCRRPVAVVAAQSLTRPLVAAAATVGLAAAVAEQWLLAVVAAISFAAGVGSLVALRRPSAIVPADDRQLRVVHGNVWYDNDELERSPQRVVDAIESLDGDVVVISEYTPEHAAALTTTTLREQYPFAHEAPGRRARGSAIFSRLPITTVAAPLTEPVTLAVEVAGIVVFGVHTPSPIANLDAWNDALDLWSTLAPPATRPAMAIGDFNADLLHPSLRAALRHGWRDAHADLGAVWSVSWPTHYRWMPPFVRLDRALVNAGVAVVGVGGAALPGSDHRLVAVTVAIAAPLSTTVEMPSATTAASTGDDPGAAP